MTKIGIFNNEREWHESRAAGLGVLPTVLPQQWPVLVYRIVHVELLAPIYIVITAQDIADLLKALARQAETEFTDKWKRLEQNDPPHG